MNYRFRIRSIEINDFMSVEHGVLNVPQSKPIVINDEYAISPSEILGVYGPNDSGKTAFVDSVLLLKSVLKYKPINDFLENVTDFASKIRYGKEFASFKFSLLAYDDDIDCPSGSIDYGFSIRKGTALIEVFDEELNITSFTEAGVQLKSGKKPSRYLVHNSLVPALYIGTEDIDKVNSEILKIRKSCDCSQSFFLPLLSEYGLKGANLSDIWNCFIHYVNHSVKVIGDFQMGAVRTSVIPVVFHKFVDKELFAFYLDQYGKIGLVDNIRLKFSPEVIYKTLKSYFDAINDILRWIIPDMHFELVENCSHSECEYYLKPYRKDIEIPFELESYGVKKIFSILISLIELMCAEDVLIVIDELDEGLNEYFLGNLLRIIKNSGYGQLMFTAHNLRPLEKLDRNSIYFVSNNPSDRYMRIGGLKDESNLRDVYLRSLNDDSVNNKLIYATNRETIAKAFKTKVN